MLKMFRLLIPVVFVGMILAPAFGAGDAGKGKELYMKRCKSCHAEDGAGTPAMQKKFGDKLLPLGGKEVQAMKDAEIAKKFNEAANHKALIKSLQPGDLDNVIAFIRTLKK
jgi:cytochrome c